MTKTNTNTNRKFRRIIAIVAAGSVAFGAYTMGVSTSPGSARGAATSNVQKKQTASQQSTVNNVSALRKAGGGHQEY